MNTDTDTKPTDDAFAGGFEGKDVVEEKIEQPATETPPDAKIEEPAYVKELREELAAMKTATASFNKQFSTVFGTVGRFEKLVKDVQEAQSKATEKQSSAAFDKLKEQFPELANMTEEAIQNFVAGALPKKTEPETDEERAERIEAELEILNGEHPNWQAITGAVPNGVAPDPEHPFRKWLAGKTEAYQKRITNSESALDLSRAITRFLNETKEPAKPAPQQPARAEQRRARVLEAVQPRGDGGPPASTRQTVDDAFAAGFAGR